ncbi:hypothetical protein [Heyndrickxia oleronia]|jgi:uncharacterized membrane protein|uniref:hypothetical protein n=1 Tax=Heyndrickxia oleronia TaxID=38875 RepID=UPI00242CB725|nr:hypothetical protein [Heyndrickxia oleronia]MCI1615408.1 hypothetical protein [Heyndrickxia oleronia]
MDPFTFGMIAIGSAGGTLVLLSKFEEKLNKDAIKIALEITKYGSILWFLQHLSRVFIFWI